MHGLTWGTCVGLAAAVPMLVFDMLVLASDPDVLHPDAPRAGCGEVVNEGGEGEREGGGEEGESGVEEEGEGVGQDSLAESLREGRMDDERWIDGIADQRRWHRIGNPKPEPRTRTPNI